MELDVSYETRSLGALFTSRNCQETGGSCRGSSRAKASRATLRVSSDPEKLNNARMILAFGSRSKEVGSARFGSETNVLLGRDVSSAPTHNESVSHNVSRHSCREPISRMRFFHTCSVKNKRKSCILKKTPAYCLLPPPSSSLIVHFPCPRLESDLETTLV